MNSTELAGCCGGRRRSRRRKFEGRSCSRWLTAVARRLASSHRGGQRKEEHSPEFANRDHEGELRVVLFVNRRSFWGRGDEWFSGELDDEICCSFQPVGVGKKLREERLARCRKRERDPSAARWLQRERFVTGESARELETRQREWRRGGFRPAIASCAG
ncbi:mitochondrial transcription termination factorfamily protein [Striga asiatica]|uniref:Mitochondrial transcription termination factorfamily protein n=1 Tax=Striga asiatica TaxID=4170 RepID=A0A5A7NYG5_STRAF|nr:mitochondrial transcription termination factorfamily protein [Striga asiatica]